MFLLIFNVFSFEDSYTIVSTIAGWSSKLYLVQDKTFPFHMLQDEETTMCYNYIPTDDDESRY